MRLEVEKTACQQAFTMLILTMKLYELLVVISLILDHSKLTFTDVSLTLSLFVGGETTWQTKQN